MITKKKYTTVVGKKWLTGLFLLATLAVLISLFSMHPILNPHAATANTAEDNFQRANTTMGWGTTSNSDGLTNYPWLRSFSNTSYAYIQANGGVISYAGVNGHKVAGYVNVPAQKGGDALAEISFSAVGNAVGGLCLQVTAGVSWYQADMNTSNKILEIRKRLNGIMTTVASVPVTYSANTSYWIRLDVQNGTGSEQVNTRIWVAGTTEPTNWQVTWTDSNPLPAGHAGAMGDWFRSPAPGEQVLFQSWSYAATGQAVPAQ